MAPTPPEADPVLDAPPSPLEDPGTAQALLFLGWIPPAIAALIGGIIVAFTKGSLGSFFIVFLGGTVAGYITCLVLLFTVGHSLERRHVGPRTANAFLILAMALGVGATYVVAVVESRS